MPPRPPLRFASHNRDIFAAVFSAVTSSPRGGLARTRPPAPARELPEDHELLYGKRFRGERIPLLTPPSRGKRNALTPPPARLENERHSSRTSHAKLPTYAPSGGTLGGAIRDFRHVPGEGSPAP